MASARRRARLHELCQGTLERAVSETTSPNPVFARTAAAQATAIAEAIRESLSTLPVADLE